MIRLYAKEVGESLKKILESGSEGSKVEMELGEDFKESADAKLDDIFQED
jgi:hypothetical protein